MTTTVPLPLMRKLMMVLQLSGDAAIGSGACAGNESCFRSHRPYAAERISIPEHLQQRRARGRPCARGDTTDRIRRTPSCTSARRRVRVRPRSRCAAIGDAGTFATPTVRRQRASCRSPKDTTTSSASEGLPQKTVTPDPETAARIEREQALRCRGAQARRCTRGFPARLRACRYKAHASAASTAASASTTARPRRRTWVWIWRSPEGTPIHAPAAGIVAFAEPDLVLTGGTVLIDHGFGLTSAFLHMSRSRREGRRTRSKRGQVIRRRRA